MGIKYSNDYSKGIGVVGGAGLLNGGCMVVEELLNGGRTVVE